MTKRILTLAATAMLAALPLQATHALDDAGAEALARKSGCFKCHAVDKKKDGPPYREIAAKFKGKPDAESKLFERLTKGAKVKIDGKEEDHELIKTKDAGEVRDVVKWILSH
jgi:cytochrome c